MFPALPMDSVDVTLIVEPIHDTLFQHYSLVASRSEHEQLRISWKVGFQKLHENYDRLCDLVRRFDEVDARIESARLLLSLAEPDPAQT